MYRTNFSELGRSEQDMPISQYSTPLSTPPTGRVPALHNPWLFYQNLWLQSITHSEFGLELIHYLPGTYTVFVQICLWCLNARRLALTLHLMTFMQSALFAAAGSSLLLAWKKCSNQREKSYLFFFFFAAWVVCHLPQTGCRRAEWKRAE
jgi:hypothetical protein